MKHRRDRLSRSLPRLCTRGDLALVGGLLLLPGPAWAYQFHTFVDALIGCFLLHLTGLIVWWRRWDFDLKLGYVVTFPVCLYVGGFLIAHFKIRTLPALYIPLACLFVPVLVSVGAWLALCARRTTARS